MEGAEAGRMHGGSGILLRGTHTRTKIRDGAARGEAAGR